MSELTLLALAWHEWAGFQFLASSRHLERLRGRVDLQSNEIMECKEHNIFVNTSAFGLHQQACSYSMSISVAVDSPLGWPKRKHHMHPTNATKPKG